jgi:hypothetical protein
VDTTTLAITLLIALLVVIYRVTQHGRIAFSLGPGVSPEARPGAPQEKEGAP